MQLQSQKENVFLKQWLNALNSRYLVLNPSGVKIALYSFLKEYVKYS